MRNEVLLDSYFPVNKNNELIFSKSNGPELWVILLEKAYAKLLGEYAKLQDISTEDAMFALTGAPR